MIKISSIQNLVSPYILILIFYVQLVLIIINIELFDLRETLIYIVWISLLSIPNLLLKKDWYFKCLLIIIFLEGLINLIHIVIVKGPLTVTSLFVLANTNVAEAKDFIEFKFDFSILFIVPYLIIFIVSFFKIKYKKVATNRILVLCFALFCFIFILENLINNRFLRKGVPQFYKVLTTYYHEVKSFNLIENRSVKEIKCNNSQNEKNIFVLILGESSNRNHMSIYGYKRKTSPKLEKRNDIIIYNNVVSSHSNTIHSVLNMISEMNLINNKKINESSTLIDVFHSVDYKTYWISNQPPLGVWDSPIAHIANTSDVNVFVNTSSSSSFEATYTKSFDEKVIAPFLKALNEDVKKNKFIVVHLMGNHSSYAKRYPDKYSVFEDDNSNKKNKIINEYDNSMLYTDFIVNELFDILTQFSLVNKEYFCSSIYLSDHSENIYDENNQVGHDYAGSLPKSNVEVPFILWFNQRYYNEKGDQIEFFRERIHFPFITDDLFHSVIDLNRIDCECFDKSKSLFNENYNKNRPRILEDNQDYDLK